jgi:excisionase family DNA binding protein
MNTGCTFFAKVWPAISVFERLIMKNQPTVVSDSQWLTATEVADYLKVQSRTVLIWTRQGKVKAYALSGTKRRVWRYLRSDVDSLLFGNPVLSSGSAPFVLSEGKTH